MPTAQRFKNFSDEEFIGVWNKEEWKFQPGESMMIQSFLAFHFAKYLIDRELNKMEKPTNSPLLRKEMLDKCVGDVEIDEASSEKVQAKILNTSEEELEGIEEVVEKPKKVVKKAPAKKAVKKTVKKVKEDDFKGLK